MTTEMTPRSPGRRMTAAVLAVPVAALGIVLLPPNMRPRKRMPKARAKSSLST